MAIPIIQPVFRSPKSISHMQVVIDRLQKNIEAVAAELGSSGGSTYDGTATVNLAVGDVVYPDAAGSLDLAQADAVATAHVIGIVTVAALATATATVTTDGIVTNAGWALTTDTIYYLDPSTAGAITATAPTTVGQIVMPVGIAVSATQLRLLLSPLVLL